MGLRPAPTWCTNSRYPLFLRSLCTKSGNEKRCTEGSNRPPCISFPHHNFRKKRIDDEFSLCRLSSSILIIPRAACSNLHSASKKLTSDAPLPAAHRQSNNLSVSFSPILFLIRHKPPSPDSFFLLSETSSHRFSRHFTLIYPAVAEKLTTKAWFGVLRRQFLPIS